MKQEDIFKHTTWFRHVCIFLRRSISNNSVYVMIFIMLNKIWFKLNWNLTVCFYYTPKYKITNILMILTVYKLKWRYLIRKQDPTGYQNKGISKLDVRKRRGISVDRAEDIKISTRHLMAIDKEQWSWDRGVC